MKRRDFINTSLLSAVSGAVTIPTFLYGCSTNKIDFLGKAKNIIFLVSDGMSSGTLNMTDLLLQRKQGYGSAWLDLYRQNKIQRALMDTASANSLVTDSAAASSSWGGGKRVKNGYLNVNEDGSFNKPILQKFKDVGKAVGCVTTCPITHATPAGFCINFKHRNMQDKIASEYLKLKFDVMMGGGLEYFNGKKREDKKNIFNDFTSQGFQVVKTKDEMNNAALGKPIIGVFSENGTPYALDRENNPKLQKETPSLAEMTQKAISIMSKNENGFVLQVEGGKVDWAAHANDTVGLLYEQIDFDEAITEAMKFAEGRDDTLVIITTDHGNANPGLIKHDKVNEMFDTLQTAKQTNDWVLNGISKTNSVSTIIERIHYAQGIAITKEEAKHVLKAYNNLDEPGLYSPYKLPFQRLAEIQKKYNSVGWAGMNHSADFVELAMFGPGSKALPPFIQNFELHNFMLKATGIPSAQENK